jgi:DNA sulfur modification protein DndB
MDKIEFSLSALRGTQGGHTVYTAMLPIRLLPRLFPIRVDAQQGDLHQSFRHANVTRVRGIAVNLMRHRGDTNFPPVVLSIEQPVRFTTHERAVTGKITAGQLAIPLDARVHVIDGIDLIYALQRVLAEQPERRDDCMIAVLHVDPDGSRLGQIYSDLAQHRRAPAQSLRIGLDDRDENARLTREVIARVAAFKNAIEMQKTTISNRSRKLFTLSALYQANRELLADQSERSYRQRVRLAVEFWTEVAKQIPGWQIVVAGDGSAAETRAQYIHCHAIGLAAIARAGRGLLAHSPESWKKRLARLATLDWSRKNTRLWEGRAMIGGRLSKSSSAVARAGNAVKVHLGIALTREEAAMEP